MSLATSTTAQLRAANQSNKQPLKFRNRPLHRRVGAGDDQTWWLHALQVRRKRVFLPLWECVQAMGVKPTTYLANLQDALSYEHAHKIHQSRRRPTTNTRVKKPIPTACTASSSALNFVAWNVRKARCMTGDFYTHSDVARCRCKANPFVQCRGRNLPTCTSGCTFNATIHWSSLGVSG